jgi:hypothetical protein
VESRREKCEALMEPLLITASLLGLFTQDIYSESAVYFVGLGFKKDMRVIEVFEALSTA